MNRYTVYAILGSLAAALMYALSGSELAGLLINIPGIIIVAGGTLLTTVLSQSLEKVRALFHHLPELVQDARPDAHTDCETLLQIADWYRRGNIRIAERMVESLNLPVLRYGIELILDRNDKNDIMRLLKWRIGALREADLGRIQILRTMSAFAPAFGMLGTLFGLVHMLYGLGDSGLSEIGLTMGFAMTSTVYGLIAANLVFKPLTIRMERQARHRQAWLNVQYEAILMIHERRHPMIIQEYLNAFLNPEDPQLYAEPRQRLAESRS